MASYINIFLQIETPGHCAPYVNSSLKSTVDLNVMAAYVNFSLKVSRLGHYCSIG